MSEPTRTALAAAGNGTAPPAAARDSVLAREVRAGLFDPAGKRLPSHLLYDDLGSVLFDAIGLLPEYGLTRADRRILVRAAPELAARLPGVGLVVELGSGNGHKTRPLLTAIAERRAPRDAIVYRPIDISRGALGRCAHELSEVAGTRVQPIADDYLPGLATALRHRETGPALVLFLGSTIGNFERPDAERFLREVRAALAPGDALLLGTDLVKPVPQLRGAYDDALGITAAFNLNLLERLNRELDAEFDLAHFMHRVRWDARERRIEMHLLSRRAQTVPIHALATTVTFRALEGIWTESSHKYLPDEPRALAARAGFTCAAQWLDPEWPFAESLLIAS